VILASIWKRGWHKVMVFMFMGPVVIFSTRNQQQGKTQRLEQHTVASAQFSKNLSTSHATSSLYNCRYSATEEIALSCLGPVLKLFSLEV